MVNVLITIKNNKTTKNKKYENIPFIITYNTIVKL